MELGRQLQPVIVKICGGEAIDREHWESRIRAYIDKNLCAATNTYPTTQPIKAFTIYPDANND